MFLPSSAAVIRAQSQTSGRIAGTVTDSNGAGIARAQITITNNATADQRHIAADEEGNYSLPFLPPGEYQVEIKAPGFNTSIFGNAPVVITETTLVNVNLSVAGVNTDPVVVRFDHLIQRDGPQLGRVVDSRAVAELPLATRNFTQILGLSPGTSVELPDNTAVGRNSQNISVNGARSTQNNYQINGADANLIRNNNLINVAIPAPETIEEFKVETSLYDASFGRSGGGNIQAITKTGGNEFHGSAYEYFRDDSLNANNPFLKAAGVQRPVLNRNVFGGLIGGPIKKEKAFFFFSYEGTRESNGASVNSLSSNVLIAPGLTDDRSEQTIRRTFSLLSINPISLHLLNAKLPNGQYVIPTPQVNGRYSGSTPADFHEDQFNLNGDYRVNEHQFVTLKAFVSNSPVTRPLFNGPNVPGFAAVQSGGSQLVVLQHIYEFKSTSINEARIGHHLRRQRSAPEEPIRDSDVGIIRSNAETFPGLPLIRIAPNAGGVSFGTATVLIDQQIAQSSTSVSDVLSKSRGEHSFRIGVDIIYYQHNSTENLNARGQIDFNNFIDFLNGAALQSVFGTGINYRSLRATDYSFFVQDDWKTSSKLTFNLGLRYELDLPGYDTRGRNTDFDPALYKPRLAVINGNPIGPPAEGFVQSGNVISTLDLPDVLNVGKRIVKTIDPNNFAPRLGFAYAPLKSGRMVIRGGYGIFYSRISFTHLSTAIQLPPNYIVGRRNTPPFATPFFAAPSVGEFPIFIPGIDLATLAYDRNMRTPYFQQYNTSAQLELRNDLAFEAAYVGGRGMNLLTNVGINQARLASPQHPVINEVLSVLNLAGAVITTNTAANAQLRAPFQGVALSAAGGSVPGFGLTQTTAQSTYNSLQISITRRISKGLQFLGAYTYSKSIDNASGGAIAGAGIDSGAILGNQLDNRANRGVSNFDRTHRFVVSYLWDLSRPAFAKGVVSKWLLSNWEVAGVATVMSGLPLDIVDSNSGSLYLGNNNGLSRPSWAAGATLETATSNVPAGYFFNPFAFARPVVRAGQSIASSNGSAFAGGNCSAQGIICTDFGNLGRNVLRGPHQTNLDLSVIRRFRVAENKRIEFRADFFNVFNHVNFANPISNLNAVLSSGGSIDPNTGRIINAGDFGRITSTSNNPRLIMLAVKLSF